MEVGRKPYCYYYKLAACSDASQRERLETNHAIETNLLRQVGACFGVLPSASECFQVLPSASEGFRRLLRASDRS